MRSWFKAMLVFGASVAALLCGVAVYIVLTTPDVTYLKTTIPYPTAYMNTYQQRTQSATPRQKLRVKYIPLHQVPEMLQRTIILAEDASFWVHKGIDWYEMRQSFWDNLRKGRFVRGGSTITQQVARNLYLSSQKSIFRKLQEMWLAHQLENVLSKRRILEIYVNIIEWGPGIFGVHKAARYYFNKLPAQLTLKEIVQLAATIPSPIRDNPFRKSRRFYWRCQLIARRLWQFQVIDDDTYNILRQQLNPAKTH